MKKKKTPYLNYYEKCMNLGAKMPFGGLCMRFNNSETFDLFIPTEHEFNDLNDVEGCSTYWASGVKCSENGGQQLIECFGFTTLRQTIVLFCAAINNEL